MVKTNKSTPIAVAQSASLAGKAMARLETAAKVALAESDAGPALQLVASAGNVSALIKTPGFTLQIENGQFAVTIDQK
jgi:hypothetical protein